MTQRNLSRFPNSGSYARRRYVASRGGHAPGHLREALLEAVDDSAFAEQPWWERLEISFYSQKQQTQWDLLGPKERGRWLVGRLWNCTDVVPGSTCDAAGVPMGSSFASVVRQLLLDLR